MCSWQSMLKQPLEHVKFTSKRSKCPPIRTAGSCFKAAIRCVKPYRAKSSLSIPSYLFIFLRKAILKAVCLACGAVDTRLTGSAAKYRCNHMTTANLPRKCDVYSACEAFEQVGLQYCASNTGSQAPARECTHEIAHACFQLVVHTVPSAPAIIAEPPCSDASVSSMLLSEIHAPSASFFAEFTYDHLYAGWEKSRPQGAGIITTDFLKPPTRIGHLQSRFSSCLSSLADILSLKILHD
jgi:hypothetical protein